MMTFNSINSFLLQVQDLNSEIPANFAPNNEKSILEVILFYIDYFLLPIVGLSLIFIVYKLIKQKKILIKKDDN